MVWVDVGRISFKGVASSRPIVLQWRTSYSGIYRQHKLESYLTKVKDRGLGSRVERVYLAGGIRSRNGGGGNCDQNTLYEILRVNNLKNTKVLVVSLTI